ncbi:hypothetical protein K2173_009375 [Erythroxylum novogranatense]|uniref:Uncharacterized protein n=1 Tax=Erythroxylum novogranatense TaxID=1862640 RepID=A0AAV8U6X2_9ROSI|nr:hypothetical protein K2173_009375 [Erythroxylum novogranatense]
MVYEHIDDSRARASNLLDSLEKSINAYATEVAKLMLLKEQVEALVRENSILKRAAASQHERHEVFEDKNGELLHLKHLVSQYQEQLTAMEVRVKFFLNLLYYINNYKLMMHLRQAHQSSPIPGRFHPDVF